MNESHQMRRSRRGADFLLRVRCTVYNGTLGSMFGHRFDRLANTNPAFGRRCLIPPMSGRTRLAVESLRLLKNSDTRDGTLRDVTIEKRVLKTAPVMTSTPSEAEALAARPLTRAPAPCTVRAHRSRFRGRWRLPRNSGQCPDHPCACAADARYQRWDVEVGIQRRPVRVEAKAIDFDIGQDIKVGTRQILDELHQKRIGAAIGQIDHRSMGPVEMCGHGPGFAACRPHVRQAGGRCSGADVSGRRCEAP
jgi:hypothetical protein